MPPKGWRKPEGQSGPVSQEEAAEIIGKADVEPEAAPVEQAPLSVQRRMTAQTGLPMSPDLRRRIAECNVIYIVCKQTRPNDETVTITSSKHDAKWLKEFV